MNFGGKSQRVRAAVVVLVATVLLGACGGGSDTTAEPKATPAPPRTYTTDQLSSALPAKNQVPDAGKKIFQCPGSKQCDTVQVAVAFEVEPPVAGSAEAERAQKSGRLNTAQVTASVFTTARATEARQAKARAAAETYDGDFSTKAKRTSKTSYTFGFKGTGTLEDASVGEWDGYLLLRETDLINIDGNVDGAPLVTAELNVVSGTTMIAVYAGLLRDGHTTADAGRLAQRLADDYVKRLNLVP